MAVFYGDPLLLLILLIAEPAQRRGEPSYSHLLTPSLTKVLDFMFQTGFVPASVDEGYYTGKFKRSI